MIFLFGTFKKVTKTDRERWENFASKNTCISISEALFPEESQIKEISEIICSLSCLLLKQAADQVTCLSAFFSDFIVIIPNVLYTICIRVFVLLRQHVGLTAVRKLTYPSVITKIISSNDLKGIFRGLKCTAWHF